MKIIEPDYEVVRELSIPKKIERIARICYKSEGQICEGSDIRLISKLIERKHLAMLEHADLCFRVSEEIYLTLRKYVHEMDMPSKKKYKRNFLRFSHINDYLISGNIRAWIETLERIDDHVIVPFCFHVDATLNLESSVFSDKDISTYNMEKYDVELIKDYNKITYEERMLHETFSVIFTSDRGFTHEMVRMRVASFAQESTRWCNYSLEKFGADIAIIKPIGFDDWTESQRLSWSDAMETAEKSYMYLLNSGMQPQMARGVLPQNLKSDICVTANLWEWKHIFNLRACDATGPAHPQMKELMVPLLYEQKKRFSFAFDDLEVPA